MNHLGDNLFIQKKITTKCEQSKLLQDCLKKCTYQPHYCSQLGQTT